MPLKKLYFYFDYLSPYAYFSWRKIKNFCEEKNLELILQPIVFGKLLDHWGQLGPAEIPPKRKWLMSYCIRYAKQHGFKFTGPKKHPFNTLTALRLSLPEVSGSDQMRIVDTVFKASWTQGKDLGDRNELIETLNAAHFDGGTLVANTDKSSTKDLLKKSTSDAIERGVFGVPTVIIDDQLFWGNDQFEHMAMHLSGDDGVSEELLNKVLKRERGIDRKALSS